MPGGRIDILVAPDLGDFPGRLQVGLRQQIPLASGLGKAIGLGVVAGTAVAAAGLKQIIDLGTEYTGNLNTLKAVTQATSVEMVAVGRVAQQLGSDMSLPATSAADAAAAMLELAKGGLSVQEAMQAARGTLQLAAAAQIDAARAAEIQSSTLNQFRLSADQAGRVADVLANAANAASGEITDMGLALKYVGPIAQALDISIEDTAASVGLLANNGIQGENAGTALRGMLASLAAPSAAARKGIRELGLEVFDSKGKFVGMRAVVEQLATAQKRMTDQQFAANSEIAFGREPLAAITALAAEGAISFDDMARAVSRQGGAADVASAKTQGLGGAIEGLKSQLETAALGIFAVIERPLEGFVRGTAQAVSTLGPQVADGLAGALSAAESFGPSVGAALRRRGSVIRDAVTDVLGPLGPGARALVNQGINIALDAFDDMTRGLASVVRGVEPVARGIGAIASASTQAGGPVSVLGTGLDLLGDAAAGALRILAPIGDLVGGLASGFAALPGPIQSTILALTAYNLLKGRIGDRGPLTGLRQFSDEMRVQQGLAAATGTNLGRAAAAQAAFETSTLRSAVAARGFRDQVVAIRDGAAAAGRPIGTLSASLGTLVERAPALTRMRDAFQSAADGAGALGRTAGGIAAAGSGLRSALGGITSALGGPVGLALAGAGVALSLYASHQAKTAAATRRSTDAQHDYAKSLRDTGGAINEVIREQAAKRLLDEQVLSGARALGISSAELVDAILGQGDAYQRVSSRLAEVIGVQEQYGQSELGGQMSADAVQAVALRDALGRLTGEFTGAQTEAAEFKAALGQTGSSMLEGTEAGRTLAGAMGTLADRTSSADDRSRALKDALDALSGNQLNYEQAVARLNEQVSQLGDAFDAAGAEAKNTGRSLVDASGGINTTTEAGRRLLDLTDDLGTSMAEAAQQTFDYARANGDDVPTALLKAAQASADARSAFVESAIAAGVGADEALRLADRYGLIPSDVATLIEQPGMTKAQVELLLLRQRVNEVPAGKTITVSTLSEEAKKKLLDLGFTVRTLPDGRVEITANTDAARASLNSFLAAPATKVVQIVYRGERAFRTPGGSIGLAQGAVLAAAYASGGMHKATPMRAGVAAIVPPNTWRIIGDRLRDDELYLPLNRSIARNHALLAEGAARMGYALVRMYAAGGIATSGPPPLPQPAVGVAPVIQTTIVAQQESAAEIAQRTTADIDWRLRLRWNG